MSEQPATPSSSPSAQPGVLSGLAATGAAASYFPYIFTTDDIVIIPEGPSKILKPRHLLDSAMHFDSTKDPKDDPRNAAIVMAPEDFKHPDALKAALQGIGVPDPDATITEAEEISKKPSPFSPVSSHDRKAVSDLIANSSLLEPDFRAILRSVMPTAILHNNFGEASPNKQGDVVFTLPENGTVNVSRKILDQSKELQDRAIGHMLCQYAQHHIDPDNKLVEAFHKTKYWINRKHESKHLPKSIQSLFLHSDAKDEMLDLLGNVHTLLHEGKIKRDDPKLEHTLKFYDLFMQKVHEKAMQLPQPLTVHAPLRIDAEEAIAAQTAVNSVSTETVPETPLEGKSKTLSFVVDHEKYGEPSKEAEEKFKTVYNAWPEHIRALLEQEGLRVALCSKLVKGQDWDADNKIVRIRMDLVDNPLYGPGEAIIDAVMAVKGNELKELNWRQCTQEYVNYVQAMKGEPSFKIDDDDANVLPPYNWSRFSFVV